MQIGTRVKNTNTGDLGTVTRAGTYLGDGDFVWSVKLDRATRLLTPFMNYYTEEGMMRDWAVTDEPAPSPITYEPRRVQSGNGTWTVCVVRKDASSPLHGSPDPVVYTVCKGVEADKNYDTDGVAPTYMTDHTPPFTTNSALRKATRIANQLNSGSLTIERLQHLLSNL